MGSLGGHDGERNVFVVRGRNEYAAEQLCAFLRALSVRPISWENAINKTGEPFPYVGQILDAGFDAATAAVVLLTPDETVSLRPEFATTPEEAAPSPQARPNVLFEAGMAMGKFPKRTILVQLGEHREVSDFGGRHGLHMDNSARSRDSLVQRLRLAGCTVDTDDGAWLRAGDFSLGPPAPPHTGPDVDEELRIHIDEVRSTSRVIGRIENVDDRRRWARITVTFLGQDERIVVEHPYETPWVDPGESVPFVIEIGEDVGPWHRRRVQVEQLYDDQSRNGP